MPGGPDPSRSVRQRASGGVNPLAGAKCEVQPVEPVCFSASLPDAVMRTHHFRSEVIYLARNFKVRSCSLYPSTYCRGLLLMKSHSELFILHERHNVLFHFLVCFFFFFPTQNELFICVTLTGLPICVIPKGIGYLEKSCAYCTCQTSLCPKAALSPVIDFVVNRCRAGRVCDCRASARLLCPLPSPAPCHGSCPLGLDVAAGDPRRIQTTSLLGRHLSV